MELTALLVLPIASIMLAAFALALAGLLQYRLAALLSPEVRVAATLVVVGVGALLSVTLTSRTLDEAQRTAMDFVAYEDYASGFAASRWLSLLLLGAALIEAVRGWLAMRSASFSDPARPILGASLAYYFGTLIIQSVASDHTGFSHKDLYLPIVLVAIYFQRVERVTVVVETAKWTLFALTAGSLAAIVLSPQFVLHRPEPGIIPGIDWRLYGLTEHANTLGPAALIAIILEVYQPCRRWPVHAAHLAAALGVFVLAQSRTAWGAAIVITAVVVVPLALRAEGPAQAREPAFRRAVWTLVACIAAVIAAAFLLVSYGTADYLQRKLELTTLNGRFQIWDITLEAWRENPLFGYGAEIWGVERQFRFYMFHVGHAHNQVVQTLGEAGLAGLGLLLLLLATLLRAALRCFVESRGVMLALLLVLLARCVTEAPMRSEGLLTWSSFLHVLILVFACHFLRTSSARPQAPARGDRVPLRQGVVSRNPPPVRAG